MMPQIPGDQWVRQVLTENPVLQPKVTKTPRTGALAQTSSRRAFSSSTTRPLGERQERAIPLSPAQRPGCSVPQLRMAIPCCPDGVPEQSYLQLPSRTRMVLSFGLEGFAGASSSLILWPYAPWAPWSRQDTYCNHPVSVNCPAHDPGGTCMAACRDGGGQRLPGATRRSSCTSSAGRPEPRHVSHKAIEDMGNASAAFVSNGLVSKRRRSSLGLV